MSQDIRLSDLTKIVSNKCKLKLNKFLKLIHR